jgi:hypothetical protein
MGRRIGRLGLVNYRTHPTEKSYRVFNFNAPEHAEIFERELNREKVDFEKTDDIIKDEKVYLYAIHERDFEKAARANYTVSAETRKKIIPNVILRYALLLFFFGIIAFALIGYYKNQ